MAKHVKANKRKVRHLNIAIPSFLILHFHSPVAESLPFVYFGALSLSSSPSSPSNPSPAQHLSPIMSEVPVVEQPKPVEVTETAAIAGEPAKPEETPAVVCLIFQLYHPLCLSCFRQKPPLPLSRRLPLLSPRRLLRLKTQRRRRNPCVKFYSPNLTLWFSTFSLNFPG